MSTLHCVLENGVDLYVNERQKIRHYRARSIEERRRIMPNCDFLHCTVRIRKLCYYRDFMHSFNWKLAIEHDGGV